MTCPVCGADVEPGQAFCESCGSALASGGTAAPADGGLTAVEQDAPIELTRPTSTTRPTAVEALVTADRC
ncbi:MAG: zinc-ribbon domain-containing protein, partial [Janthinobacterium lividum]